MSGRGIHLLAIKNVNEINTHSGQDFYIDVTVIESFDLPNLIEVLAKGSSRAIIIVSPDCFGIAEIISTYDCEDKVLLLPEKKLEFSAGDAFSLSSIFSQLTRPKYTKSRLKQAIYQYYSFDLLESFYGQDPNPKFDFSNEKHLFSVCGLTFLRPLIAELDLLRSGHSINKYSDIFSARSLLGFYFFKIESWANAFFKRSVFCRNLDKRHKRYDGRRPQILITGWYGTETVGDKAILLEALNFINAHYLDADVTVTSIDLRVSWHTRFELGIEHRIIPLDVAPNLINDNAFSAVFFGGGPIMDSSRLPQIADIFQKSARMGTATVIFGCGVGPLQNSEYAAAARVIFENSAFGFFRDEKSKIFAMELGADQSKFLVGVDPALNSVARFFRTRETVASTHSLVAMLREQTTEYSQSAAEDNQHLNDFFITYFEKLVSRPGENFRKIKLVPMHSHWRGNDDRILNQRVSQQLTYLRVPLTTVPYQSFHECLSEIIGSKVALAMRYHAHIFAIGLEVPFLSLNYTGKSGKIDNLMTRVGLQAASLDINKAARPSDSIEDDIFETKPVSLEKVRIAKRAMLTDLAKSYEFLKEHIRNENSVS